MKITVQKLQGKIKWLLSGWNVVSTPDLPHTTQSKGVLNTGWSRVETPWPDSVKTLAKEGVQWYFLARKLQNS